MTSRLEIPILYLCFSLSGKTAIVTGSSRGIGHAIALKFAEHGANIIVHYVQNEKAALETVQKIEILGNSRAIAVQADMGSITDIQHLFETTIKTFGKLNILVNSACLKRAKRSCGNNRIRV